MKTIARKNKLVPVAASVAAVVLLLGGYTALAYTQSYWPFSAPTDTPAVVPADEDPNTSDPTLGSDKNDTPETPTDEPTTPSQSTKRDVQVGIAYAALSGDMVEVRAFVSEVIEGSGTCTATFSKSGQTVTGSSNSFIDATTSQCEPISLARAQFSEGGSWQVVVSYDSADAKGQSGAMEVQL
jgi:hypothetical protein